MSDVFDAAIEIREVLPQERERRRYALLQASAVIYAATYAEGAQGFTEKCMTCVERAETLLGIIEQKERNK